MKKYLGKTIAFIPVRGGSKSIPLKNIKFLNNRPLIYWAIDAVVQCTEIDKVVISTDSEAIKSVVEKYDSDKIIIITRSEVVSTDTASTESVMLEFAYNYEFENIILVQATSPLLTTDDISRGISKYKEDGIDSVLSVVRQKRFIWKEEDNKAQAVNYSPLNRPRRQDFNGYLVENGAFYITSKKRLMESKLRISGNIAMIEMSETTYFEIDEPSDWIIVENLMRLRYKEKSLTRRLKNIKCLITDCDGVLTDAGMYYSELGDEFKKFNTKDGMAFSLLKKAGIITGIITGENVKLVERRANKMQVDEVYLGINDKKDILDEICKKHKLSYDEIAYIGDDINDLEVIMSVGFACTVNDGMSIVKDASHYITKSNGGQGAVREVAELILEARK